MALPGTSEPGKAWLQSGLAQNQLPLPGKGGAEVPGQLATQWTLNLGCNAGQLLNGIFFLTSSSEITDTVPVLISPLDTISASLGEPQPVRL